jgi:hypothetical protein
MLSTGSVCELRTGLRKSAADEPTFTSNAVTDLHLKSAKQSRLVFVLPDYLRDLYKSFGSTLMFFAFCRAPVSTTVSPRRSSFDPSLRTEGVCARWRQGPRQTQSPAR